MTMGEQSEEQGAIARLTKMVETLTTEVTQLRADTDKPSGIPQSFGPERDIQRAVNSSMKTDMTGMRSGESRDGFGVVDFGDPFEEKFAPQDIVKLDNRSENAELQRKLAAWRKTLDMDDGAPFYGKILTLIGPTQNRRGPRKYKVHVMGVGKEGFLENELILEKRAS